MDLLDFPLQDFNLAFTRNDVSSNLRNNFRIVSVDIGHDTLKRGKRLLEASCGLQCSSDRGILIVESIVIVLEPQRSRASKTV